VLPFNEKQREAPERCSFVRGKLANKHQPRWCMAEFPKLYLVSGG